MVWHSINQCQNFYRHWSALGIGRGSPELFSSKFTPWLFSLQISMWPLPNPSNYTISHCLNFWKPEPFEFNVMQICIRCGIIIKTYVITLQIALALLLVLTMTTISTSVQTTLPRVSYIKAMDVYIVDCPRLPSRCYWSSPWQPSVPQCRPRCRGWAILKLWMFTL